MALDKVAGVFLALLVIAIVAVVTFIAVGKLGDVASADDPTGYAANATTALEQGMYNAVKDADDWGTFIGLGVLISVIFGFVLGAMYLKKQGYI